jgi:hypothetical protein
MERVWVGRATPYLIRGGLLIGAWRRADRRGMTRIETEADVLRERALVLADELNLDRSAWYLRALEDTRDEGQPADVGVLVRAYWELQRVTGRADLRDEWRRLTDALWQGDAA